MINNAQFRIIGRIGKINAQDKVTRISIASDRQVKKGDNWETEANWNTVTIFNEALRKRISNPKVGRKGAKVIIEGSIQSNSYEKNGETIYQTTLVGNDFDILAFPKDEK